VAEYVWLAEQVTGIDAGTFAKASRLELADSALRAPAAGFGEEDFYPDVIDKAAVLTCRLAWDHPLPDGNKELPGLRSCSSWTSTGLLGSPGNPTWTKPRRPCWPWPLTRWTKTR